MKAVICHANTLDTPSHTYITGPIHTKTMNMDKKVVVRVCEQVNL